MLEATQGLPANSALDKVLALELHIVWECGNRRLNAVGAWCLPPPHSSCPSLKLYRDLA
jgi:hypothetical protein